jgi:protein-L-isoaspartate(D-aspartate) O-methyltransferase
VTTAAAEARAAERERMVERQVAARGVRDPAVLEALRAVPREAFLPEDLREFAYSDTPLPIAEGQTISQPYVVALMTAALELSPGDRVLEIGTGSGYGAAVLSRVAAEVYTVERHEALAERARETLGSLGFTNVHVLHGDGTLGWPEHAPYDGISVTAGGPSVPRALVEQLAGDGRLVIPVGDETSHQRLLRLRRRPDGGLAREDLGAVRFVPLVGAEGWDAGAQPASAPPSSRPETVGELLREACEPFPSIEDAELGPLLDRIGGARVVCLGEATHGTSEFYRFRTRITRALLARGFTIVAVEADWPDAARIHGWIRHEAPREAEASWRAFARFPTWMWRNEEVVELLHALREHNAAVRDPERMAGFYGLDLYSLAASIGEVLAYLERVDPEAAAVARLRYGCLTPWERDPATYGRAALTGRLRACEPEVAAMLSDLLRRRLELAARDGDRYLDAVNNARLVAGAERYYRVMYRGHVESWNLRDRHMFETLESLLEFHGPGSRAVVWAHNSHLGDADATEMGVRGELNVGRLCRERFGEEAYLVGFGTDRGTVAAARGWDEPVRIVRVRPAHDESYERLCRESGVPAFLLPLREPARPEVRDELEPARLERAIGVVYRPETELQSHYFDATLPHQFDEWIWIEETAAVRPLAAAPVPGVPDTHPFAV